MASTARLEMLVDLKDQVSDGLGKIGGALGGVGDAAKVAFEAAAAAGAAVVASMGLSLKEFSTMGEDLRNMSLRTGISVENLSGLNVAAQETGTTMDAVGTAIKLMQSNLDAMTVKTVEVRAKGLDPMARAMDEVKSKKLDDHIKAMQASIDAAGKTVVTTTTHLVNHAAAHGKAAEAVAKTTEHTKVLKTGFTELDVSMAKLEKSRLDSKLADVGTAAHTVTEESKKAKDKFDGLNLSLSEIKAMTPDQQFVTLGNAIANIKDPAARTAEAVKLFGRQGTDMIPMFTELGGSLDAAKMKAQALGVYFSTEDAAAAAKAQQSWTDVGLVFKGLEIQVGKQLAPAFSAFVEEALPHIEAFVKVLVEKVPPVMKILGDAVQGTIGILTDFYGYLRDTGAFTAVREAISLIWEAIETHVVPAWNHLMDVIGQNREAFEAIARFLFTVVVVAILAMIDVVQGVIDGISWLIETARALYGVLQDSGAIGAVQAALQGVWGVVQNSLIPALKSLMDGVEKNHVVFEAIAKFFGLVFIGAVIAVIDIIKAVIFTISLQIDWIAKAFTAWANFGSNVKGLWTDVSAWIKGKVDAITGWIDGMIQKFTDLINKAQAALNGIGSTVSTSFQNLGANLGFRAAGGPVSSGSAYVVGEEGPELFVPGASGAIVPAGASLGGGGIHIVISGNSFLGNPQEAARAIGDELVRYLKLNQRV